MNSVLTVEFLAVGKAINKSIDYLMYYPLRQHVELKRFQVAVYTQP